MRKSIDFNAGWRFLREDGPYAAPGVDTAAWEAVTLPHTWNREDGQMAVQYYRGKCWYRKAFSCPALAPGQRAVLKFEAVEHIAEVFCNGRPIVAHEGGYAAFYADLTDALVPGENLLAVSADNAAPNVYPQNADFTFFGGIYRPVTLLVLEPVHFALDKSGSEGVFVTPSEGGGVRVDAFVTGGQVVCRLTDALGETIAEGTAAPDETGHAVLHLHIDAPHRWQGVKDPYLYTAELTLADGGKTQDRLAVRFGFRTFRVDVDQGFFLNGVSTPLRGVCRHQDRVGMGTAITEKEHAEDMALICEMGANTIRLAHYQHAQPFYDLCDETGMVVWAEIPFISQFIFTREAHDNTLVQLTELIAQNYNHASICFWSVGNELSNGGESEPLWENVQELHALAKQLDPSRLTTIANSTAKPDSPLCHSTDVFCYNEYFGWYMGAPEDTGPWMDKMHAALPDTPFGISEYGAEAVMKWHSETPQKRDYTEEYQALVHEVSMKAISERPYLWGTFLWNMFDFAAANRDEGGAQGFNNKGLVTNDRKTKKEAFYLYKAYLSDTPFVHLCGRRFVNRDRAAIDVKVYSNQPAVTLSVNGGERRTLTGDKVFVFKEVPLRMGANTLVATSGPLMDVITLRRVAEPDESYILPQPKTELNQDVVNWFANMIPQKTELEFPEGRYHVKMEIGALLAEPRAAAAVTELIFKPLAMGAGAAGGGFSAEAVATMKTVPLDVMYEFIKTKLPDTALLLLNERLNQIPLE